MSKEDKVYNEFMKGVCLGLNFLINNHSPEELISSIGLDLNILEKLHQNGLIESDYLVIKEYLEWRNIDDDRKRET